MKFCSEKPGSLIVLEGPDGVGKTTVAHALVEELKRSGIPSMYLSFPGREPGTLGGQVYATHEELKGRADPGALQILHIAAHIDAIRRVILPQLEEGITILLDRYWWSTIAYGRAYGADMVLIDSALQLEALAWGDTQPSLVILFDREVPYVKENPDDVYGLLREFYAELTATHLGRVCIFSNDGNVSEGVKLLVAEIKDDLKGHGVEGTFSTKTVPDIAQNALPFEAEPCLIKKTPTVISKLSPAQPTEVYRTYWQFASERQRIFHRRALGTEGPWTDDPVLRAHRFTNAYRAADRVSQYLIQNVIYQGSQEPQEIVFRTLLFKFFNKIETWETLTRSIGELRWADYSCERYEQVLLASSNRGERIFSSAYIMPTRAPGFRHPRKHTNFLGLLEFMMKDALPSRLRDARRLSDIFITLRSYPLMGDFLAFQYAIDLNYSCLFGFDEMEFVVAGPGARSGLRKCFASPGGLDEADLIKLVADHQEEELERNGEEFKDLWGRRLHLIDCQNLFCEVDKYARVVHPTVEGIGGRSRIKQIYTPRSNKLSYQFPPAWGISPPKLTRRIGANI